MNGCHYMTEKKVFLLRTVITLYRMDDKLVGRLLNQVLLHLVSRVKNRYSDFPLTLHKTFLMSTMSQAMNKKSILNDQCFCQGYSVHLSGILSILSILYK